MCLATVYAKDKPEQILFEYVSTIQVDGNRVILTDVMGDNKVIEGTIAFADLTGGKVQIACAE